MISDADGAAEVGGEVVDGKEAKNPVNENKSVQGACLLLTLRSFHGVLVSLHPLNLVAGPTGPSLAEAKIGTVVFPHLALTALSLFHHFFSPKYKEKKFNHHIHI